MTPDNKKEHIALELIQKGTGIISVNKLLERPSDQEHIDEWTQLLAQPIEGPKEVHEIAVVLFRLGKEWAALPTKVFVEVADYRKIHRIPHCSNSILQGIVNLNGELRLCVALHHLLDIELDPISGTHSTTQCRMLFIKNNGEGWIFPADEVFGIHYCDSVQLGNVPVTISKSASNYLKGVINWNGKIVGYLDDELLFYRLKKELHFQA